MNQLPRRTVDRVPETPEEMAEFQQMMQEQNQQAQLEAQHRAHLHALAHQQAFYQQQAQQQAQIHAQQIAAIRAQQAAATPAPPKVPGFTYVRLKPDERGGMLTWFDGVANMVALTTVLFGAACFIGGNVQHCILGSLLAIFGVLVRIATSIHKLR